MLRWEIIFAVGLATRLALVSPALALEPVDDLGQMAPEAPSATLCVADAPIGCRASLQAAVNAASPGDTIKVTIGSFDAHVTITKPLTLLGGYAYDLTTRQPGVSTIGAITVSAVVRVDGFTLGRAYVAAGGALTLNADRFGMGRSPLDAGLAFVSGESASVPVTVTNSVFVGPGGGSPSANQKVLFESARYSITHVTARNFSAIASGAILTAMNSIFDRGAGGYCSPAMSAYCRTTLSLADFQRNLFNGEIGADLQSQITETGAITGDPGFIQADADLHLLAGSLALDKAFDVTGLDADDLPRARAGKNYAYSPVDTARDLGAFEAANVDRAFAGPVSAFRVVAPWTTITVTHALALSYMNYVGAHFSNTVRGAMPLSVVSLDPNEHSGTTPGEIINLTSVLQTGGSACGTTSDHVIYSYRVQVCTPGVQCIPPPIPIVSDRYQMAPSYSLSASLAAPVAAAPSGAIALSRINFASASNCGAIASAGIAGPWSIPPQSVAGSLLSGQAATFVF